MRIQSIQSFMFQGVPKNYAKVSEHLSRSAQPQADDFVWLKLQGITDVINLRTMTDKSCLFDEAAAAEKMNIKYHNIAINHRKPTEENITDFLNLMFDAEKNNKKVHVHCLEGKDRTGLCIFVYKCLREIGTMAQNKAEWLKFGHDFVRYPNMIGWAEELVQKFKANKMFLK